MTKKLHVHKGDEVMIISGKDAGKKGKILEAQPQEGKVIVEGANIVVKHVKPKGPRQQGGRIKQESPLFASKVMLICPHCGKPSRTGKEIVEDGTKVRVCKKCGETITK